MIKLRSLDDFKALVLGASILATGGGGDPDAGLKLLVDGYVNRGKELRVYDLDEVSSSSLVASAYYVGSLMPERQHGREVDAVRRALAVLREKLGYSVDYFIPVELGGENTAVALYAASSVDIPVVDADRVGRAAPEIHQDTLLVGGLKLVPASASTPSGTTVVVLDYGSVDEYEGILRRLSVLGGGYAAVVDGVVEVGKAIHVLVRNSITRCIELGRKVLEARTSGRDPVKTIAEELGGWVVFHGKIVRWEWRSEGGFLTGTLEVEGLKGFEGRRLRSFVKNEHIMVWIDDSPLVMPPDLFILVRDDGEPVLNNKVSPGMKVWGVAAPAPPIWRTEKGLELFGPRHFGFNYEYVPVEKLVAEHVS
jgi:DUF917 family protein